MHVKKVIRFWADKVSLYQLGEGINKSLQIINNTHFNYPFISEAQVYLQVFMFYPLIVIISPYTSSNSLITFVTSLSSTCDNFRSSTFYNMMITYVDHFIVHPRIIGVY